MPYNNKRTCEYPLLKQAAAHYLNQCRGRAAERIYTMNASSTAVWLNESFAGFDEALLSLYHSLASVAGGFLTPLMKIITFLGEKGIVFFLLALVLMCFSSERDKGVCIFGAVCCGALITNIILKDNIARARPFEAADQFFRWWEFVGSPMEDGYSFPSGHVTAAAAGMTAISLMKGKKMIAPSVIVVLLMGISRNYLMAHYPSDVLAAMIVGLASGFIAWIITRIIFRFLEDRYDSMPIAELILDFDIREILPFELPSLSGLSLPISLSGFGRSNKAERKEYDEDDEPIERRSSRNAGRSSAVASRSGSHVKAEPKSEKARPSIKLPSRGGYVGKHEKR